MQENNLKNIVDEAVNVLKQGGIILYPTDTIWGLGCDATNPEAVKRIVEIKQRDDKKSMLVLLDVIEKVSLYVKEVPELAWDIFDLATKPTTVILPGAKNLAENLINDDGSIGIRITKEKFSKDLIFRFRKPVVSTSANVSGQKSPANYSEISNDIISAVDYIVDYSQDDFTKSTPSSIIKIGLKNEIQIVRQ